METKRCSKCGEVKLLECFTRMRAKGDRYGRGALCRPCAAKRTAEYRAANADPMRARRHADIINVRRKNNGNMARWRRADPARARAAYRKNNRQRIEKIKETRCTDTYRSATRDRHGRNAEELSDTYVRACEARRLGVSANQIPDEFVEMKRAMLASKRSIRAFTTQVKKESK